MSNKSEIQIIAEAVLANARVLEALIAKLPDATKQAVAAEVSKTTPAPAAVQVPAPAPVIQTQVPAMPAVPFPMEPTAPAPTPPAASPSKAPFTDQRGLVTYAMTKFKELGAEKGKQIQVVLNALGINNINEAKPAQYDAIFAGIEAIK